MTKAERRATQRNENGDLCFCVGKLSGGVSIEDDIQESRTPKNKAEAAFCEEAQLLGWKTTKRGWPDFFCVNGDDVYCVEVKPSKDAALKQNQIAILGILSSRGIPCYMWSPDGGFEKVKGIE